MFNFRAFSIMLPLLFVSIFTSYNASAQTYLPVGPQTNVPEDTVIGGGWTECFRNFYADTWDVDELLANCPGALLMLACSRTGSSILTLLAQGDRSDVIFDTGNNEDVLHIANGVGWYFNDTLGSWGFVREGDIVFKSECDTDSSGANDERLCWHLGGGGYRCGATEDLNGSEDFERIVYTAGSVSSPIPTLSEWGMIGAATGLILVGVFFALRRRLRTSNGSEQATIASK